MASAKITLHCDEPVRDILCTAIRDYAVAAYPPGGSECAQVARYTLLELADQINDGIGPESGSVEISKRPRAMVKAAIQYYFDRVDAETGTGSVHRRELFLQLLCSTPASVVDLEKAAADDMAA
jgi:hypothetical protein